MSSPYTGARHEQSEQVTTLPLCVFVQTIARFIEMVQLRPLGYGVFVAGSLPHAGIGFSALSQLPKIPFLRHWPE